MIADLDLIGSLETSARVAMPALIEEPVRGWVVRVSGGTTKRVNSANPVSAGADLSDVRAAAERAYRAAGLPVRFRLTPHGATGWPRRRAGPRRRTPRTARCSPGCRPAARSR